MLTERRGSSLTAPVTVARMALPWPALDRDHGLDNLLIPWLAISLVLIGAFSSAIGGLQMQDPDDYMRLLQVEALLDGQSWWDVSNHRMGGAAGAASMHWSRLVDLPIALLILVADVFVSHANAVRFAVVTVPLLQLLAAMALMRGTLRCLEFKGGAANIGTLILPLLPLTLGVFAPLRIDHHGWQAVLAIGILRLLVDRRAREHKAVLAGATAALLVSISIEGLPLLAAAGLFYALVYLSEGRPGPLAGFLCGLVLASAPLFAMTHHPAQWAQAWPDAIGWPHLTTFALAALLTAPLLRLRRAPAPLQNLLLLAAITVISVIPVVATLGIEGLAPFSGMDPLLRTYWLDNIAEALPVTAQSADAAGMLLSMLVLLAFAIVTGRAKMERSGNPRGWLAVCVCAGAMCLLSLVMFRAALVAQMMLTPLCALLLRDALRVASRFDGPLLRIPAILLALLSLTPAGGSIAGAAAMRVQGVERRVAAEATSGGCDLSRLAVLPAGHVFATFDLGPELLARTGHTVEAGSYHRNQAAMLRVVRGFTASPAAAEGIVRGTGAGYVVLCKTTGDVRVFSRAAASTLAGDLISGKPPSWLEPLPAASGGALVAYRVVS
jgi:hypothetical protein